VKIPHIIYICSGYMAPEYAVDGFFSVKSDVFSFGILMLEIICGKKNRRLYSTDKNLNLVDHVRASTVSIFVYLINMYQ